MQPPGTPATERLSDSVDRSDGMDAAVFQRHDALDVCYTLFRHKWFILCSSVAGVAGAGFLFLARTPPYLSDALLLVGYVRASNAMAGDSTGSRVQASTFARQELIDTEIEILMSSELALEVAERVGPERVVRGAPEETRLPAAATAIRKGFSVENPRSSYALRLTFQHPEPGTARSVLLHLIGAYQRKRAEVQNLAGPVEGWGAPEADLTPSNQVSSGVPRAQVRVGQTLGVGTLPEINVVQSPSSPYRATRPWPLLGTMLGSGLALGLGIAILVEGVFDRTVRKPSHVASLLRLPLFLTLPSLRRSRLSGRSVPLPRSTTPEVERRGFGGGNRDAAVPTPVPDPLDVYYEALRDRLMMYFEMRGVTHRPKLVGMTACAAGAGATTLATGLAAALSETGDGNVLLVDMNRREGAGVHPFHRGRPACDINQALEPGERSQAQVRENLYVVTAHKGSAPQAGSVRQMFAKIVPRLQASDYDYIIFDLPPVTETSISSKLAGLLDMTLLILESGKTTRNAAGHASALLAASSAQVAAVLNKYRPYVPRRMQAEP